MEDTQNQPEFGQARALAVRVDSPRTDLPHAQVVAWISDTRRICERVAEGAVDVLPVFWIRLYGVLTDIADLVELTMDHFDRSCAFPLARLGSDGSAVRAAIEALTAVYTADELLYIEYRRHHECHPLQGRYRSRPAKSRAHDESGLAMLEDANEALGQLLLRCAWDEHRVGIDLARRGVERLRELESATRRMFCG